MSWEDMRLCIDEPATKALCNACPVLEACLWDSIAMGDHEGRRGGLTGPQRRRVAERVPRDLHGLYADSEAAFVEAS